jgi:hypothetical protein
MINDSIIKDADLTSVVNIAAIECYINHLLPTEHVSDLENNTYAATIGHILTQQRELIACRLEDAQGGFDAMVHEKIQQLRNQITAELASLPDLDTLQTLELSCSKDTFLEVLIMAVKNSSLAHQHDFFKIKNAKRRSLEKKIVSLKGDFNANIAEVLRTERDLNRVVDDAAREEVLKMQKFEHLNNEKITPNFLSLAKKPNKSDCLTDVCDDNGAPFEHRGEQDTYMRNYYASIYKRLPDTVNDQSINNFLGETVNHPVVCDEE